MVSGNIVRIALQYLLVVGVENSDINVQVRATFDGRKSAVNHVAFLHVFIN